MTKLILLFKDLAGKAKVEGGEYGRDQRLKMMGGMIGRPIGSGKDMTMGEAHFLIEEVGDALQRRDPVEFLRKRATERMAANRPADGQDATPAEAAQ